MNCTICGKPIVLSPTAAERAAKVGGKVSDYIKLFTTHTYCVLGKRDADTKDLMRRIRDES